MTGVDADSILTMQAARHEPQVPSPLLDPDKKYEGNHSSGPVNGRRRSVLARAEQDLRE